VGEKSILFTNKLKSRSITPGNATILLMKKQKHQFLYCEKLCQKGCCDPIQVCSEQKLRKMPLWHVPIKRCNLHVLPGLHQTFISMRNIAEKFLTGIPEHLNNCKRFCKGSLKNAFRLQCKHKICPER
jgi:hypothetical protein